MGITEQFQTYFRFRVAHDESLREECARLRYQVYAQELSWERQNLKRLEQDQFDPVSIHCLLEHIPSGTFAGTVRLVFPSESSSGGQLLLPLELLCQEVRSLRAQGLPGHLDAEISRLAVPMQYRRRGFETGTEDGDSGGTGNNVTSLDARSRQFPLIAIGLYLGLIAVSKRIRLNRVFALMEPRLQMRLGRLGLKFDALSEGVDHKGHRVPYRIPVSTVTTSLTTEMGRLYQWIDGQLDSESLSKGLPEGTPLECRMAG